MARDRIERLFQFRRGERVPGLRDERERERHETPRFLELAEMFPIHASL